MTKNRILLAVCCLLPLAGGCAHNSDPAPNANIVELRRALYSYMIGPGHEPTDRPENSARILALLKALEPLDTAEKVNVALDIYEYYDATDNLASSHARTMLVKYGNVAFPFASERLKSAINQDEMRNLIRDIEGS